MEFLTMSDIQKMTGWSKPTVIQLFARPDFPALTIGRPYLVTREAFEKWCGARKSNKDFRR